VCRNLAPAFRAVFRSCLLSALLFLILILLEFLPIYRVRTVFVTAIPILFPRGPVVIRSVSIAKYFTTVTILPLRVRFLAFSAPAFLLTLLVVRNLDKYKKLDRKEDEL